MLGGINNSLFLQGFGGFFVIIILIFFLRWAFPQSRNEREEKLKDKALKADLKRLKQK